MVNKDRGILKQGCSFLQQVMIVYIYGYFSLFLLLTLNLEEAKVTEKCCWSCWHSLPLANVPGFYFALNIALCLIYDYFTFSLYADPYLLEWIILSYLYDITDLILRSLA